MTFAGTPRTVVLADTERRTSELAPTVAQSPTSIRHPVEISRSDHAITPTPAGYTQTSARTIQKSAIPCCSQRISELGAIRLKRTGLGSPPGQQRFSLATLKKQEAWTRTRRRSG